MSDPRDVVITGIGVVSSIGMGSSSFWEALCGARSGIGPLSIAEGMPAQIGFGGELRDFDAKAYVRPRKALKVMSRELQTAFAASLMAMEQAALHPGDVPAERIGTVFGSEMLYGPPVDLVDAMQPCLDQVGSIRAREFGGMAMRQMYPLWMLRYLPNMAACHVGIAVDAQGPNNTLVLDDTSALAALEEGASVIRRGAAEVVLVGATGTRINETRLLYRGAIPWASRRDPLESSSRPMGRDRDGMVGGEGAATIVLESATSAERRGAAVLGRVLGSAVRFIADANRPRGSQRAIEAALRGAAEQGAVEPSAVRAVVSHAMGDPYMDACEAAALSAILPRAAVTAPAGALGHTGAACGGLGLATGLLMVGHAQVPPTVNGSERGDDCPVDLVCCEPRPLAAGGCVAVLSHTAQGHAAAALIGPAA